MPRRKSSRLAPQPPIRDAAQQPARPARAAQQGPPTEPGTTGGIRVFLTVLCILGLLILYGPALQGEFLWDDDAYISNNPTLADFDGLVQNWTSTNSKYQYYPLVLTSFWIERQLWGLKTFGYHFLNVLFHAANALLLARLLRKLDVPFAWFAAALFAMTPLQVESVAWITERKNVMSLFFYLLSALAMLRHFNLLDSIPSEQPAQSPQTRWKFYAAGFMFFVVALLSKTVTASLPAALLLVVYWKRGTIRRRDVLLLLPFFAAGIAAGLLTSWVEKHVILAKGEDWSISLVERILLAGRALWFYAAKFVWPHPLIFFYPKWKIDPHSVLQYLAPIAAIAVPIALFALRNRIGRGPLVAVLFFEGTLFPALGFSNVYPMRYSFVADHFQYHASIGLCALAAAGLALAQRRFAGHGPVVAALLLLAVLGTLTWKRAHDYQTPEALWLDTVAKNPDVWAAWNNLGIIAENRNELAKATEYYRKAYRLNPNDYASVFNQGLTLQWEEKYPEAIPYFRDAIRLRPEVPNAYLNLGAALEKTGDANGAIKQYEELLRQKPDFPDGHGNLGLLLMKQQKPEQAARHLEAAVKALPSRTDLWVSLSDCYYQLNQPEKADEALRRGGVL